MANLAGALKRVCEQGETLTQPESRAVLAEILEEDGSAPDSASDLRIAALAGAIAARGATADELTGFAEAMRERALAVPLSESERGRLVDTCGTGGDGLGTFNISTGAALAAAAAGAWVAKHGNRGVTSRCGSADVLEALGIPVEMTPERAAACLRRTGFTFLHAPALHPALRRVHALRRSLGFRTLFNLAGPLTNPAGARAQVLGVYAPASVALISEALARLGARHAFVVHGRDGLDEISLHGASDVAEVQGRSVRLFAMTAADAGLDEAPLAALTGGDARENAAIIEAILRGEHGPRRDVVVLNAAAALVAASLAADFRSGAALAASALDSGAGADLLEKLRREGR